MKIKIVSDLHLEFSEVVIPNNGCDLLILAGDILVANDFDRNIPDYNPYTPDLVNKLGERQVSAIRYLNFLKQVSNDFPNVIAIAGNHEFYHGKWIKSIALLREIYGKFPNIHFLENDHVKIDNINFLGATLWTNCNKGDPLTLNVVSNFMSDFRLIRNDAAGHRRLKPSDTVVRHRETLKNFKNIIENNSEETFVVIGHHAPSSLSIHEMYQSEHLTNGAYYSDLSDFILDHPQIKLWVHGHMHNSFDYMIGNTRVVCNPRGYQTNGYKEETGFNVEIKLEI